MDIKTYLANAQEQVELALTKSLADKLIPTRLQEAMEYSLRAGGKRLRPILVMAGAEAMGGQAAEVIDIGVALEMIHTFSLIHDDLPAMDNDDWRRGKPTSHKVFGEAGAILAGDALLAEAFWLIAKNKGSNSASLLEIISDIAAATGGRGMTGGQQIDMDASGEKIDEAQLTRLHRLKTGCLIAVSTTSGAKFCGALPEQIEALQGYGEAIGLAFQIADDILDIEGNQAEIGKDVGSDVNNAKATYPAIIGLEQSKLKAKSLIIQAIDSLAGFDERADPLREIANYVIERKK